MSHLVKLLLIGMSCCCLQACITKIVTVPAKVAYGTTKVVVKGTAKAVDVVIPDGDDTHQDKK